MSKSTIFRRLLKIFGILAALVLVVIVLGVIWLLQADFVDLRSDSLKQDGFDAHAEQGRRLLEQAAERHGLEAWKGHRTVTVVARDIWTPGQKSWWPQSDQRLRAQRLLGTFTSRVELLDGPGQGEIWGIQSWAAYKRPSASAPAQMLSDQAIEFYLPTLQYFDELPFRILHAPLIAYNGTGTYLGREYDRVLATWGSPEPHYPDDQYDLWIDKQTGRIDVVRYTVRDTVDLASPVMRPLMKVFGAGTIHFQDYREVGGVLVPFKQFVTLAPPEKTKTPLDENFFHKILVDEVQFDDFDPSLLVVDPTRPEVGDDKPSSS